MGFTNNLSNYWLDLCIQRELKDVEIGDDDITLFNLLNLYYDLYLTRFKYDGIPDSIKKSMYDLSNMDRWLWYSPAVCFFEDKELGLQVLPVVAEANFNKVFFPTSWDVYGANGYSQKGLNFSNSVLVFNDKTRIMPLMYIIKYARKILKLEAIANVNIDDQKNPYIVEIEEDEKKSIKKFFQEVDAGAHRILTRKRQKGSISDGIKVNQLKVDFQVPDYLSAIDKYENKILTFLGYNSVQIEKAERLITSEADSNNEKTRAQFTSAFEARKTAFDRVNEMFGVNLTIEPNELTSLKNVANDVENNNNINNKGVEDNGVVNG